MNLQKLFEMQQALDNNIMDKHPELKGQDNLDWKLLALQVELGECANEWRGFKKWSNNQEPRTTERCVRCAGEGKKYDFSFNNKITCDWCGGTGSVKNPLLEEYVDCLHFILSIGIEIGLDDRYNSLIHEENIIEEGESTLYLFAEIYKFVSNLFWCYYHGDYEQQEGNYKAIFTNFVQLGKSLGFTWDEIKQAYFDKNEENHARQEHGY